MAGSGVRAAVQADIAAPVWQQGLVRRGLAKSCLQESGSVLSAEVWRRVCRGLEACCLQGSGSVLSAGVWRRVCRGLETGGV